MNEVVLAFCLKSPGELQFCLWKKKILVLHLFPFVNGKKIKELNIDWDVVRNGGLIKSEDFVSICLLANGGKVLFSQYICTSPKGEIEF